MEGIAGNAEFFNILGAKLSGSEAFILLLIAIVIFAVLSMAGLLLKNGGAIKNILLSREETAVKRESKEKDQDHEIEKLRIHQKN